MTELDYLKAAAALFNAFTFEKVIPLLMLGLLVTVSWVVLARANRDPDFNIADILKDPITKKVSSERTVFVATWVSSTWALSVVLFAHASIVTEVFGLYVTLFALNDAAKRIAARKYGEPPPAAGNEP